jgi:ubiquinone biosynthesis protein UbiJ
MPEYKTPLPGILAAMLETGINRLLSLDDGSADRLQRLEDRMLQLDLEGVGIILFFAFTRQHVEVGTHSDYPADTVISGSPVALFSMAVPDGAGYWGTPESRVTISGDANLARDLERLFSRLDPDWEGGLSRLLGDVWGHQVAAGLRAGADQIRESAENAGVMLEEYLKSNQSPLARAEEFQSFTDAVQETRAAVERLESRIADSGESEISEEHREEDKA